MRIGIIGGGYAGLLAAYKLSKKCDITLYEEHDEIGHPRHCTGLVSMKTIEMIGAPAKVCVTNCYSTIKVYGSGDNYFEINKNNIVCHIDRICLEKHLFQQITGSATILLNKKVDIKNDSVITCDKKEKKYDAVIIAEGNQRKITKKIVGEINTKTIPGINAVIKTKTFKHQELVVGFDHYKAEGFFYWLFPLSKKEMIIGLGSINARNMHTRIKSIAEKHGIEISEIKYYYGGGINIGRPIENPVINNIVIIGDASGLNKPITGGGLYPQAKIFSNIEKNNDCKSILNGIKNNVLSIKRTLEKQYYIADVLHNPKNQRFIDELIKKIRKKKIDDIMSEYIDYDEHETLLKFLFRHPTAGLSILPLVRYLENPWLVFLRIIKAIF